MIQKAFDAVVKVDIDALVVARTGEFKTLEYKQELPGHTDNDKREFLADVSSFANASGGDIVYGVKAAVNADGKKTGEPEAVTPLSGSTADLAKLRLEEMIRNGIDPRLPVQIKEIAGWGSDGQGFVILLRIPKSFASPHMVTFKGTSRFFARNSAGKYQLDVAEIRGAVLATDSQADRIRRFREERLGRIIADETPVVLSSPHRLVLHVIPIATFLNKQRLDLSNDSDLAQRFSPFRVGGYRRYNLDGFLTWKPEINPGDGVDSYCQLFFDGTVEMVYSDLLRVRGGGKVQAGGTGYIASVHYEQHTIAAIQRYLQGYIELGLSGPVIISLALLGCKGSYLSVDSDYIREYHPIDRDVAILPDVVAEDLKVDVPNLMKPLFDAVWNACGFPRSFNYDEKGNWHPR